MHSKTLTRGCLYWDADWMGGCACAVVQHMLGTGCTALWEPAALSLLLVVGQRLANCNEVQGGAVTTRCNINGQLTHRMHVGGTRALYV